MNTEIVEPEYASITAMASWGGIAQDILLKNGTVEEIQQVYGLSDEAFINLCADKRFRKVIDEVKESFQAMGPNASVIMRSRAIVDYLFIDMVHLAKDLNTDTKERIKLFNMFCDMAQLGQKPNEALQTKPLNIFISGVPGLEEIGITIDGSKD